MLIRPETPADANAITSLTERAFAGHPFSSRTEQYIVRGLRDAGVLTISLVTELEGVIVGHVAISPVTISDHAPDWYGLGPISVDLRLQGKGIGSALIRESLSQLAACGAAGCVVLGDPNYYDRFGFLSKHDLLFPGPPPEYFMSQSFGTSSPRGNVSYHSAFASEA